MSTYETSSYTRTVREFLIEKERYRLHTKAAGVLGKLGMLMIALCSTY